MKNTVSLINLDSLFSQFLWHTSIKFLSFLWNNCGSFLSPLIYFKGHISLYCPDMLEVLSSFPLRKYLVLFHLLLFCDQSGSYLRWINKLTSLLYYTHSVHAALPPHQCRFSLLPTNSWSHSPGADPGHSHVVLTWNMGKKKSWKSCSNSTDHIKQHGDIYTINF